MEDIIRIPLKRRDGTTYIAIIDAADWPLVSHVKWYVFLAYPPKRTPHAKTKVYVQGRVKNEDGSHTTLYLHRLIMGNPTGMKVDHRDDDGMNNRRSNLRVCTNQENVQNSTLIVRPNKTSRYKGVSLVKDKWHSRIQAEGRNIPLGRFDEEIDAARAYDEAAIRFFGEFAATNEKLGLYPTEEDKGEALPLAA